MKRYIILTPSIGNMGGSEMFTFNKVQYLQNNGWNVNVFYTNHNRNIKIEGLRQFYKNLIPEIGFGICYIDKHTRNTIINHICEDITSNDETVIESHLLVMSFWGELIAERCKGKNILNAMEEKINPLSSNEANFVEFKLKRREILNASVKSFRRYFNDKYKDEYAGYTHDLMRAYCSNVTIDDEAFECHLPPADYNIMSIGRLDKPYIKFMFDEIGYFAKKYTLKKINILIIGASPDGKIENKIKDHFNDIQNVSLLFYGYLFPVPTKLLQNADVSIAMANSILVTADMGIPTIALDIHDLQPMGIFGRTTNNQFSRDNEPIQQISELLHEVLVENKYPKIAPKRIDVNKELEIVFKKQIDFLELSAKEVNVYYNIDGIYSVWRRIFYQTKYLFIKLLKQKK